MSGFFIKRESVLIRDTDAKRVFWLHHVERGNDQELRPDNEVIAALVEQRGNQRRTLETFRVRSHLDWRQLESGTVAPHKSGDQAGDHWGWDLSGPAPTGNQPWRVSAHGKKIEFLRMDQIQERSDRHRSFPQDWTQVIGRTFVRADGSTVAGRFEARLWHPRLFGGLGLPRLADIEIQLPSIYGGRLAIRIRTLERWIGEEKPGSWEFVVKKGRYRVEGTLRTPFKDFWTFRTQDSDGVPFFISEHFFGTLEMRVYENGVLQDQVKCPEQIEYESGNPDKLPHHEDIR